MKRTITKILSICCLLAVLACAFMPAFKLTGNYMELLSGITAMTDQFDDASIKMLEEIRLISPLTSHFSSLVYHLPHPLS